MGIPTCTPVSQLQESPDLQKITFFCMGEVDEVRGTQLYFLYENPYGSARLRRNLK